MPKQQRASLTLIWVGFLGARFEVWGRVGDKITFSV